MTAGSVPWMDDINSKIVGTITDGEKCHKFPFNRETSLTSALKQDEASWTI